MRYREEVDGLRAIAVVAVILFHGGFPGFGGGFVGVDIFFVISGYLITSIILDEKESNSFSVVRFYERRARRILPALGIVLLATTIAGFTLMPPTLFDAYARSLVSAILFLSNVYFYATTGYFSNVADEIPLLHTWSLAVEGQYYLLFPPLVLMLWQRSRSNLVYAVSVLSVISFLVSVYLAEAGQTAANFYLVFSRAWELLAGALIALTNLPGRPIDKRARESLGIVGVCLMLGGVFLLDRQIPFPGFAALVPVTGACLVIAFSDASTLVGRLLANRVLVFIGLISYSLYLWHQPLFAFLRMKSIGEPPLAAFAVASAAAFLLAYLTYRLVEQPARRSAVLPRRVFVGWASGAAALLLAAGLYISANAGLDGRFENLSQSGKVEFSPKREFCHTAGERYLKPHRSCRYFADKVSWAVFGDSHVVEPALALAKMLEGRGEGIQHLSFSGCPPALRFDVKRAGCHKWVNEALGYLEKNESITNVLLGFRYTAFLYGDQLDSYPALPDRDPLFYFTDEHANSIRDSREAYWQSLSEIITRLIAAGKTVYLLYPIPELPVDVRKAVFPFSVFDSKPMIDLQSATTAAYYQRRNAFILKKLDSLAYGEKLRAIKPFDILCGSDFCPVVNAGKVLYYDDNHLSVDGAARLLAGSEIARRYGIAQASAQQR